MVPYQLNSCPSDAKIVSRKLSNGRWQPWQRMSIRSLSSYSRRIWNHHATSTKLNSRLSSLQDTATHHIFALIQVSLVLLGKMSISCLVGDVHLLPTRLNDANMRLPGHGTTFTQPSASAIGFFHKLKSLALCRLSLHFD